jgi:excisionase family DNA binding protein
MAKAQTTARRAYRVQEVADMLGVSREVVCLWLRKGKLDGVRIGNTWLVPCAVVDALLPERNAA